MARQCGAAGLGDESRRLIEIALGISAARDLRVYAFFGRALGWRLAARAASLLEALR
jgi:hypothetical protein